MEGWKVEYVLILLTIPLAIDSAVSYATSYNALAKKACKFINGVPAGIDSCPHGQGRKSVGVYHCCVKCHPKCQDIYEARVLNGKTDGCFGECIKCSSLKKPFLHFKNVRLNMCLQCKDCAVLGLVQTLPCGDLHNAQCEAKSQIPHITRSDHDEATTTLHYNPPEMGKHVRQYQHSSSDIYKILATGITGGAILLLLAIVFLILLYYRKQQNRKLHRNGSILSVRMSKIQTPETNMYVSLSQMNDLNNNDLHTDNQSCSDNNRNPESTDRDLETHTEQTNSVKCMKQQTTEFYRKPNDIKPPY